MSAPTARRRDPLVYVAVTLAAVLVAAVATVLGVPSLRDRVFGSAAGPVDSGMLTGNPGAGRDPATKVDGDGWAVVRQKYGAGQDAAFELIGLDPAGNVLWRDGNAPWLVICAAQAWGDYAVCSDVDPIGFPFAVAGPTGARADMGYDSVYETAPGSLSSETWHAQDYTVSGGHLYVAAARMGEWADVGVTVRISKWSRPGDLVWEAEATLGPVSATDRDEVFDEVDGLFVWAEDGFGLVLNARNGRAVG
jgi:hypothetical protein